MNRRIITYILICLVFINNTPLQPLISSNHTHLETSAENINLSTTDLNITAEESWYFTYELLTSGSSDFKNYMPRDYMVANVDGDSYPDFIIWYPKRIVVWSYSRGIYSTYTPSQTSLYINRPIPIDVDHDGLLDYVIVVENDYMDGRTRQISETSQVVSKIFQWYPTTGARYQVSVLYRKYVDSVTYYLANNHLYIPWVLNYYQLSSDYRYITYYSEIGVYALDLSSLTGVAVTLKTYTTGAVQYNGVGINDYTTNYEVYIVGDSSYLYIVPSGLDVVLRATYNCQNINLDKEYAYGWSNWNDGYMVVGRPCPAIPSGAYTQTPGSVGNYWRSPQRTRIGYWYGKLILPIARFVYLSPADSENGVYFRVEKMYGMEIIDTEVSTYSYVQLLGAPVIYNDRTYTVHSVTSVDFDPSTPEEIFYGGVAYGSDGWVVFINNYLYTYDRHITVWSSKLPSDKIMNIYTSYTTVYYMGNDIVYGATLNTIYANGYELIFHRTYGLVFLQYSVHPPTILNPINVDIDNDGVKEVVFIMCYNDYTGKLYTDYNIRGLYPVVFNNGANFIVIFKKSRVRMSIIQDTSCIFTNITLYYESTDLSYGKIYIIRESTTVYTVSFNGNENYTIVIPDSSLNQAGNYTVDLELHTRYGVGHYIHFDWYEPLQIIESIETLYNVYSFRVRHYTRILYIDPVQSITPNLYKDGVTIYFQIYYRDLIDESKWYLLTSIEASRINVTVINNANITWSGRPIYNSGALYTFTTEALYPGNLTIYISYQGSDYYLPSSWIQNVKLLKYPVYITANSTSTVPALTPYEVHLDLKYSYIISSGDWVNDTLSTGYLEIQLYNLTSGLEIYSEALLINISNPVIAIDKYKVLPGDYRLTIRYFNNIYYETPQTSVWYSVYRIGFILNITRLSSNQVLTNNTAIMFGEKLLFTFFENISNTLRNMSVDPLIELIGSTNVSIGVKGFEYVLDTLTLTPGEYVVKIYPSRYRYAYIPETYVYGLKILNPDIKLLINVKTFSYPEPSQGYGEYVSYSRTTYTLTPVEISINVTPYIPFLLENYTIYVYIGNETYVLRSFNETITWTPILPGYERIIAKLVSRYITLTNVTDLTIYPMPVNITLDKGSIVIYTRDIYGRPAPGTLYIDIYSDREKIHRGVYWSNGTLYLDIGNLFGLIYVYVKYMGNASYRDAEKVFEIYYEPTRPVNPLPESFYEPIIIIILTIIILLKKRNSAKP